MGDSRARSLALKADNRADVCASRNMLPRSPDPVAASDSSRPAGPVRLLEPVPPVAAGLSGPGDSPDPDRSSSSHARLAGRGRFTEPDGLASLPASYA